MISTGPTRRGRLLALVRRRSVVADVAQGIIVGGVLAFIAANLIVNAEAKAMQTTVDGWSTTLLCGVPGNDILLQAACAKDLPAVNLPAEAVYWTATVDSSDHTLNGGHRYVLHFPAGGLPPNDAFWSLTMTDATRRWWPTRSTASA